MSLFRHTDNNIMRINLICNFLRRSKSVSKTYNLFDSELRTYLTDKQTKVFNVLKHIQEHSNFTKKIQKQSRQ